MTGNRPTAVTYVGLPLGSGASHSLGRMPLRVAYQQTMDFVVTCTEPSEPINHSFAIHDVPTLPRQRNLEAKLRQLFGAGREVTVPAGRVDEALDFLEELHPQPTNQWGMAPLWFTAHLRFRILDPVTGVALPGQDPASFDGVEYEGKVPLGASRLRLSLHNTASLGIELCFPNADAELLARVVPWLQGHLPCKLSPKQWRLWTPTRTGSFKARKMTAPGP